MQPAHTHCRTSFDLFKKQFRVVLYSSNHLLIQITLRNGSYELHCDFRSFSGKKKWRVIVAQDIWCLRWNTERSRPVCSLLGSEEGFEIKGRLLISASNDRAKALPLLVSPCQLLMPLAIRVVTMFSLQTSFSTTEPQVQEYIRSPFYRAYSQPVSA